MHHDVEDVRDETIFSPQQVGVCLCLWQDYFFDNFSVVTQSLHPTFQTQFTEKPAFLFKY